MEPCPRAGKLFGGCRFEARYDERPRSEAVEVEGRMTAEAFRSLVMLNVYVRDVCVRCGRTIERPEEKACTRPEDVPS